MALELHVLGTSSARPAHGREVSGSFLVTPEGNLAIDCGEGFQSRLAAQRAALKGEKKKLKISRLGAILLSHGHLDHTWGVLPWLKSMSLDGRTKPLMIIGPTSSANIAALLSSQVPEKDPDIDLVHQYSIWRSLGATSKDLGYEVDWILGDGQRWYSLDNGLLDELPQPLAKITISAHKTRHSVPSFAWRVATADRPGVFDRKKAEKLPEQIRMKLSQGENVEFAGEELLSSDFRGDVRPGISLIVSGDTAECSIDAQCDLLFHEATYHDVHQEWAEKFLHCTASGAARTAVKCSASYLAITHYSARIEDHETSLLEARSVHGNVMACNDGDRLELTPEGLLNHHVRNELGWSVN